VHVAGHELIWDEPALEAERQAARPRRRRTKRERLAGNTRLEDAS